MKSIIFLYPTIFVVLCITTIKCSPHEDCGSKKGEVLAVDVSGCSDSDNPCKLVKGTNVKVSIRFKAKENAKAVKTVVHGIIADIPIPFPMPHPNACKFGNVTCPLKAAQTYYYSSSIPVKTSYPAITLVVKWELKDENGDDIVCTEIPAKVVSK